MIHKHNEASPGPCPSPSLLLPPSMCLGCWVLGFAFLALFLVVQLSYSFGIIDVKLEILLGLGSWMCSPPTGSGSSHTEELSTALGSGNDLAAIHSSESGVSETYTNLAESSQIVSCAIPCVLMQSRGSDLLRTQGWAGGFCLLHLRK